MTPRTSRTPRTCVGFAVSAPAFLEFIVQTTLRRAAVMCAADRQPILTNQWIGG